MTHRPCDEDAVFLLNLLSERGEVIFQQTYLTRAEAKEAALAWLAARSERSLWSPSKMLTDDSHRRFHTVLRPEGPSKASYVWGYVVAVPLNPEVP